MIFIHSFNRKSKTKPKQFPVSNTSFLHYLNKRKGKKSKVNKRSKQQTNKPQIRNQKANTHTETQTREGSAEKKSLYRREEKKQLRNRPRGEEIFKQEENSMVAETEVIHHVQFTCVAADLPSSDAAAAVAVDLPLPPLERRSTNVGADLFTNPLDFMPSIRSGSFADIGQRRYMEDEHIRIDDLGSHLGSLLTCPSPSAFYGVFDGHGGADAAAYMKRHAMRFLFEDGDFPQWSEADDLYMELVESSVRRAFLQADQALSDEASVSRSSGTTALTALVLGRVLVVANAGDCRAVLSRKGTAIELSHDHRPVHAPERDRVVQCGGFIDDGYLNGVLSVSRALGDWDLKCPDTAPSTSPSPLIAEPELKQATLTNEDEFLIIGCDGIWDVLSSQQAVSIVRRGLRRHDDPDKSARDLAMEALRLNACDNLTVIVVCFSSSESFSTPEPVSRLRCCKSIQVEALCKIKSWLELEDADADN